MSIFLKEIPLSVNVIFNIGYPIDNEEICVYNLVIYLILDKIFFKKWKQICLYMKYYLYYIENVRNYMVNFF